jgi:hypothetical protein
MLAEQELIHHIRKITKDFEFVFDQSFVRFWALIHKIPSFLDNLDDYLQNMRKYNDIDKVAIDLDQSLNDSKLISSGSSVQQSLKHTVNRSLKIVFKLFQRLGNNIEDSAEYFTPELYRKIIDEQ